MKKATLFNIILPFVYCVVGFFGSLYSTEIKSHMASLVNIGVNKFPDLVIHAISYGLMIFGVVKYLLGVIKKEHDEAKQSIESLREYCTEYIRSVKDSVREEEKIRNNMDAVIQSKIIALKDFRDKEMIWMADHFNAQIQTFEDRMKELQNALKDKNINVNLTRSDYVADPNTKLNQARADAAIKEKMVVYNKAFKDWGIGDYGEVNKQSFMQPE